MAFTEDMSVFFNTAEFAVPATFVPLGGAPLAASVLFDAPTEDVLSGQVLTTDYSVTLPHTVWPTIDRDDVITVEGAEFTVRSVRQLGDGSLKRLVLTKN